MGNITAVIIGITSSFVASVIFLFTFSRFRPKIEISTSIARETSSDGKKTYSIKVINRGRRSVVNVRAELRLRIPRNIPDGRIIRNETINLNNPNALEIFGYSKKDSEARYARRFLIYDDIDKIWEDDNNAYIGFRIYAIDSLTNLGKVFYRDYNQKRSCLKDGSFLFGDSMEIK